MKVKKGEGINLKKKGSDTKAIRIEVNWKSKLDLDVSAGFLDKNYNLIDTNVLFYNSPKNKDGHPSLGNFGVLSGDDRDGGEGEVIIVFLDEVPIDVKYITLYLTLYDSDFDTGKSFKPIFLDSINDVDVTVYNQSTKDKLFEFTGCINDKVLAINVAKLKRIDGGWDMEFNMEPLPTNKKSNGLENVLDHCNYKE